MSLKVHPTGVASVTSKELREIQKLHELGKKYWVSTKQKENVGTNILLFLYVLI